MKETKVLFVCLITFFVMWLLLTTTLASFGYLFSPKATFKDCFQCPAPIIIGFILAVISTIIVGTNYSDSIN